MKNIESKRYAFNVMAILLTLLLGIVMMWHCLLMRIMVNNMIMRYLYDVEYNV